MTANGPTAEDFQHVTITDMLGVNRLYFRLSMPDGAAFYPVRHVVNDRYTTVRGLAHWFLDAGRRPTQTHIDYYVGSETPTWDRKSKTAYWYNPDSDCIKFLTTMSPTWVDLVTESIVRPELAVDGGIRSVLLTPDQLAFYCPSYHDKLSREGKLQPDIADPDAYANFLAVLDSFKEGKQPLTIRKLLRKKS